MFSRLRILGQGCGVTRIIVPSEQEQEQELSEQEQEQEQEQMTN